MTSGYCTEQQLQPIKWSQLGIIPQCNTYLKKSIKVSNPSVHQWMNKQNMVYTYNRILFTLKKEGNSRYNKDEPWGHCVKWNKPSTERYTLHTSIDTSNSERQKVELFLPELEERW